MVTPVALSQSNPARGPTHAPRPRRVPPWRAVAGDASLSVLLVVQGFTQFVALPLEAAGVIGHALFELGHLAFATLCALTLARLVALQLAHGNKTGAQT